MTDAPLPDDAASLLDDVGQTSQAAPPHDAGSLSPDAAALLDDVNAPDTTATAAPSHPAAPHHAPSRWREAGTPPQPSRAAAPEPEPSWGDTAAAAVHHLIPSAAQGVAGMWGALTHPAETLTNLGHVGEGLVSQAAGALGAKQDPKTKAQTEALARAVEDHYKQAYFSGAPGFKKAVGTDPFGVLMDASMLADPAAGALGKIADAGKLAGTASLGTRAAGVASKGLSLVNPVNAALTAAKVPMAIGSKVARSAGAFTSGVPEQVLKMATQAAQHSDPAVQAAFSRFASGQGDASELADAGRAALQQIRAQASEDYLAKKGALANVQPSYDPLYDAIAKAREKYMPGGVRSATGRWADANQILDKLEAQVREHENHAAAGNPAYLGLDGFDNLKQSIYDEADALKPGSSENTAAMNVYHGARDALVKADPEYANLMGQYQAGRNNLTDLTKSVGLGQQTAASATLARTLRLIKTAPGQNLLGQLIARDPRIGAMIAGATVNPWSRWSHTLPEMAAGTVLGAMMHPASIGAAAANPVGTIGAGLGAAAGFAAGSPRIMGSMANAAGRVSKNLAKVTSPTGQAVTKGLYYGSRPNDLTAPVDDEQAPAGSYAQKVAMGESNGDPNARPQAGASTASGVGQFTDPAWLQTIRKHAPSLAAGKTDAQILAMKTDPDLGKKAIDWLGEDNAATLAQHGLPVTDSNKYGMHWLGNHFFDVMRADDNTPITQIVSDTSPANRRANGFVDSHGRPRTVGEIKAVIAKRMRDGGPRALATGGRVSRQSGGRTGRSHEHLVQRLMTLAEKAKRTENAATKPLLNVPDNRIVRALDVASRAI